MPLENWEGERKLLFALLRNDSFIYIFMQKNETRATGGVLPCCGRERE
jgi:hypothetical protein